MRVITEIKLKPGDQLTLTQHLIGGHIFFAKFPEDGRGSPSVLGHLFRPGSNLFPVICMPMFAVVYLHSPETRSEKFVTGPGPRPKNQQKTIQTFPVVSSSQVALS